MPGTRRPRHATDCAADEEGETLRPSGLPQGRAGSELHLRRLLGVVVGREFRHRLVGPEEGRRPQHAREGLQLGVVGPHRFDVVAARHGDAVFRALELGLQRQEVLVGFQLGIVLADGDQPAERARELVLGVLELLQLSRGRSIATRRSWSASPWRAPRRRRSARPSPAWRSPAPSPPGWGSDRPAADSCSGRRPISPWPVLRASGMLL